MRFQYLEPKTLEEAADLFSRYNGKAKVIAGGTDLMVRIKNKLIKPEYVIDLEAIPGLAKIKYDDAQELTIGALAKVSAVETSPLIKRHYPLLAEAAGRLGSVAVRNLATIGGNLCNAAPSADNAAALLCLSAKVKISGRQGARVIPLEEFFLDPGETALGKGELLTEIQVPVPAPDTKAVYIKHSLRGGADLALVGVAVLAVFDKDVYRDIKIALGAVASTPIRAKKAETVLKGNKFDEKLIERCASAAAAESCCISDVRASAEYRQEMVEVFTRRALRSIMP
jgi:aerobic carbon-monoxide dehydrogenase medium subunit